MSFLVATVSGYHVWDGDGDHVHVLPDREVAAWTRDADGTWLAVLDGTEVWSHPPEGIADRTVPWTPLAVADVGLTAIVAVGDRVLVGTDDGRVLVLDLDEEGSGEDGAGHALTALRAFDDVPGRAEWHGVGSPIHVRSFATTADAGAVLANVHVGGIARSTDRGASWAPTIEVEADVHEVRAHPTDPRRVVAGAAVGLCCSDDAGATWSIESVGLPSTYARAVAFVGDEVFVSVSDGPFARRSHLYRRPAAGGALVAVDEPGFPDRLGRIDTGGVASAGASVLVADGDGEVWARRDDGWRRLADALGRVTACMIT